MLTRRSSGLVLDTRSLGDLTDHGRNHHTLANTNAVPVRGKFGKGMYFNGTNAYVDSGNASSFDIIDAITIEAWVNTVDNTIVAQEIVNKRAGVNEGNYYFHVESGYIGFYFYNGAWISLIDDTTLLANDTWYHTSITYDKTNIKLYVGGVEVKTAAQVAAMIANTATVKIGRRSDVGDQYFSGVIDEVKIYNRALSVAEILAHNKSKGYYSPLTESPIRIP